MRKLITPSAVEVLTLAQCKAHLNVQHSADDTLIAGMLAAAIDTWHQDTGLILPQGTHEEYFYDWPEPRYHGPSRRMVEFFRLGAYPLHSVTSVKYTDSNSAETTVSASDYVISRDGRAPEIWLAHGKAWPGVTLQSGSPIAIRYVAGHAAAADMPAGALHAIKMRLGSLYAQREDITSDQWSQAVVNGWDSFVRRYRIEA